MSTSHGANGTNGHATQPSPTPAANPLTIFRIGAGAVAHVRVLSNDYRGVFTHWYNRRSFYCAGKDCNQLAHRLDKIWKGYASVEVYSADRKRWVPFVLEISEHLELDLRGVWARGQVWEMWREDQATKKPNPVQGKMQELKAPETFPPAFDIRPPLLHLYHLHSIDLSAINPLPPRMFLAESEGDAPKALQTRQGVDEPMTDEQWEKYREQWQAKRKSPSERRQATSR